MLLVLEITSPVHGIRIRKDVVNVVRNGKPAVLLFLCFGTHLLVVSL